MMHIQSNSFTRRHLLGVCCFYERQWNSPSHITACRVSSPPPCLDKYDGFAYGLKSRSSGITVKRRNEEVVEKHFQELSSSHYEAAMEALSSLITGQKRGEKSAIGGKYDKLKRMEIYLEILGLEEKIAGLKIIHVAGTKGKGSTCAFCEAILRECGFRTGLFTSPHLIDVRERFRIDGLEISEEKFLQYFWQCWDQLKDKVTKELPMPPLFQFLTLLAFKVFVNEKVDVGIFEVGLGGTKDSTNVIKEPVVCGIASLGMDHMETLGDTLGKIASHKAGILKPYTPAFSVLQLPEAMDVIRERASQLVAPLKVVSPLSHEALNGIQLSLAGDHQFINAGLAVSLCKTWLQRTGNWEKLSIDYDNGADLPDAFLRGLSSARLSGRAQIVHDIISKTSNKPSGDLTFYLDGAHSPESVEACAEWFAKAVKEDNDLRSLSSLRTSSLDDCQEACSQNGHPNNVNGSSKICEQVLLFNCMDLRNPQILLPKLVNTCASSGIHFSKALFVPSISTYSKVTSGSSFNPSNLPKRDLRWQFSLQRIWEKIHGNDVDPERNVKMECLRSESVEALLPLEFFRKNSCMQNSDSYHPSSAVIPSLPLTIRWLRDCVKENPSLRLQVLVTGSLHLVGDVLKLLRRR